MTAPEQFRDVGYILSVPFQASMSRGMRWTHADGIKIDAARSPCHPRC